MYGSRCQGRQFLLTACQAATSAYPSTILLTFDTMTIASAAHGLRVSNLVPCVKLSIMVSKAGIPSGS
jgi:hypothetical protein